VERRGNNIATFPENFSLFGMSSDNPKLVCLPIS